MLANEMTFGVEIETHMPAGSVCPGSHGYGRQVDWLPAGWLADEDPSIVVPNYRRIKCEFVSPVLRGADGLRQLVAVINEIKRRGGKVNTSCGLHVHVGFDKSNTPAMRKLLNLVANHEKALYAVTGTKNREQGVGSRYRTCWCKSIKQYGSAAAATVTASRDRYHLLNIATGVKPTVEFRVFGASLNAVKTVAYVRLCTGLVEKALTPTITASWNKRGTPTSTAGVKEVARLFARLGWNKAANQNGAIVGEGLSTMRASRIMLARLAAKYDAQNNG